MEDFRLQQLAIRFDAENMRLSIIIVNYNVKYFLEQCLCSVEKSITNYEVQGFMNDDIEVIVVDNNSSDGSREYLPQKFPRVQFIWKTHNSGFAKANNHAMQFTKGELVLFLNPDTILAENTLQICIDWMQQHAGAGAVGVKMIDGSGNFLPESKRGFPSPLASFYKLSGLIKLFPHSKTIAAYYMGNISELENNEVDVLPGAFMMVRKNILDAIGGFDEQFFMYAEDIDLSYRIQQAGYKNYYLATATIIHFKGESTASGSLNYVKLFYKAMQQFVAKHYAGAGLWSFRILLSMAIWLRASIEFIKRVFPSSSMPEKISGKISLALLGNEIDAATIKNILQKNNISVDEVQCFNSVIELKKIDMLHKNQVLALSTSVISNIDIINFIEEKKPAFPLYIHHTQSSSMVSSITKINRGQSFGF